MQNTQLTLENWGGIAFLACMFWLVFLCIREDYRRKKADKEALKSVPDPEERIETCEGELVPDTLNFTEYKVYFERKVATVFINAAVRKLDDEILNANPVLLKSSLKPEEDTDHLEIFMY